MLDISGTMHPSKGGRFFDMKVLSSLLHLLLLQLILVMSLLAPGATLVMLRDERFRHIATAHAVDNHDHYDHVACDC